MTFGPNSITQASGIFSNCGPGVDEYELYYNCRGPACTAISGFQNVQCNTDGRGMTCSNNVKCPDGISSFQSNFTFGQNEPDPWNPSSQNEADSRVEQQQHITLSNCARFSLTSDGTEEGTRVGDRGLADDETCPKLQETPMPIASNDLARKTSYTLQPQIGATSIPQIEHSGHGPRRSTSRNIFLTTVLLGLLILLPGVYASTDHHRREGLNLRAKIRIQTVSGKVKVFAQDFSGDLAEKINTEGLDGDTFAHNLVANVISSMCDNYFAGRTPTDFTPAVVQNCIRSIYGGEKLAQPAGRFFAIFGASLLCDYAVSETYPVAQDFFPTGCEGLQELARKVPSIGSATESNAVTLGAPQVHQLSVSQQSSASLHTLVSGSITHPKSLQSFLSQLEDSSLPPVPLSKLDASTHAQDRSISTNTASPGAQKTVVEPSARVKPVSVELALSRTILSLLSPTSNTAFLETATGFVRTLTGPYLSSAEGPEFFGSSSRHSVSFFSSQKPSFESTPTESRFATNKPSSSLLQSIPAGEPILRLPSHKVLLSVTVPRENHSPSFSRSGTTSLLPLSSSDASPTVTMQRATPTENLLVTNQLSPTVQTPPVPSTLALTATVPLGNNLVILLNPSVDISPNLSSNSASATASSPDMLIVFSALTSNTVVIDTAIGSQAESSSNTSPTLTFRASVTLPSIHVSITPIVERTITTLMDVSSSMPLVPFLSTSSSTTHLSNSPIRLHVLSSNESTNTLVGPLIRPAGSFTTAPSRVDFSKSSLHPGSSTSYPPATTSPIIHSFGLHPASFVTSRPFFNHTTSATLNSTLLRTETTTMLRGPSMALSTNASSLNSSETHAGGLRFNSVPLLSSRGSSVTASLFSSRTNSVLLSQSSSTISIVRTWSSITASSLPPHSSIAISTSSVSALARTITIATNVCPSFRPDACSGTCVDHRIDRLNCGRCGAQCSQGWSCGNGECWPVRTSSVQLQHTTTKSGLPLAANLEGFAITTSSVQTLHSPTPTTASRPAPTHAGGFIAKGLRGLW